MEGFLSNPNSATFCCQVLFNLPEAFRNNIHRLLPTVYECTTVRSSSQSDLESAMLINSHHSCFSGNINTENRRLKPRRLWVIQLGGWITTLAAAASARQQPSIPVFNEEPRAGIRSSASSSTLHRPAHSKGITPNRKDQKRQFPLFSRNGNTYICIFIYIYVYVCNNISTTSSHFRDLVFSFTGAKFKQAQTPIPNPYDRYAFSRGRKETQELNKRSVNCVNLRAFIIWNSVSLELCYYEWYSSMWSLGPTKQYWILHNT